MEGTDITGTKAPNIGHYGTYYGNGCPNSWNQGGSETACSDDWRFEQTADFELLTIGTYYNYRAASVESFEGLSADNSIVPDSFCPLGWQLPYGGTGGDYYDKSRSWKYIIFKYGNNDIPDGDTARSYPLSLIASGNYYLRNPAVVQRHSIAGIYTSNTIKNTSSSYRLHVSAAISLYDTEAFSAGLSIRCVKFLASHHRRHGGGNDSY